jgi:hypothetical protein
VPSNKYSQKFKTDNYSANVIIIHGSKRFYNIDPGADPLGVNLLKLFCMLDLFIARE